MSWSRLLLSVAGLSLGFVSWAADETAPTPPGKVAPGYRSGPPHHHRHRHYGSGFFFYYSDPGWFPYYRPYGGDYYLYVDPVFPGYRYLPPDALEDYYDRAEEFHFSGKYAIPRTARVVVLMPDDQAELRFNGARMAQTGIQRVFETPDLKLGKNYRYKVKATWIADAKLVTREKRVNVAAGRVSLVDFTKTTRSEHPEDLPPGEPEPLR